jgi:hypothetical protein
LFVLDVNPEAEVHTVYVTKDRSKPLWTFSKHVWHYPFLLSNDGLVVATLAWKYVKVETLDHATCLEFWNKDGIFKSYTFTEICPHPARTELVGIGPIGDFWRTWYTDLEQDGDTFRVRTTDLYEYSFALTDGSIQRRWLIPSNLFYNVWFDLVLIAIMLVGIVWACRRWRRNRRRRAEAQSAGNDRGAAHDHGGDSARDTWQ